MPELWPPALGRVRPETVAEVRNRVISFLRDW